MATHFDRAKVLVALDAPPEVASLALLADLFHVDGAGERHWKDQWAAISVLSWAGKQASGYKTLPELGRLHTLYEDLQVQLEALGGPAKPADAQSDACPPAKSTFPTVERAVEASTPWITSQVSFAKALKIADDPRRWVEATPQMTVCDYLRLPADGALWRGRLKKQTDFGKPLVTNLRSRETIDITAEGADSPDGSGQRLYRYVLHSADTDESLLALVEDSGWIELSGDDQGCQVRLYKRATVLRPVDDPLADLIQAAFAAELWMWARGFCVAAGEKPVQIKPTPLPAEEKKIPRPRGPDAVKVAVLGGGPAGLACAWLLSKPDVDGKPAWEPPAGDPGLTLEVTLLEKACLPGGKAASVRGTGANAWRIEEHGLHMLLGFYANLPHILTLCKADDALLPISTVRLPRRADGPLDDAWNLCFEPWPKVGSRMPLENWLAANKADRFSPQLLRLAVHLDSTNSTPRPMLRAFIGAWQRVAAIDTTGSAFTGMLLVLLTLVKFLLGLLCLFELARPTDGERKTGQGEIAALATVLRWVARCAWGGANQRPETALVGELLELLTTTAIGLDMTGLFPTWAIADPSKLPEGEYVDWIRALQTQDDVSIQEWLQRYGVAPGFAESSRILDAVTAGLFTTPDQIAAGTFINGFGRLFLNYVTAPFKRLAGGTGEAVIGPMYQALKDRGVNVQLGYAVTQLSIVSDVVQSVTYQELLDSDPKEFKKWGPAIHDGWPDTERTCPPIQPPQKPVPFYAQAYVLAIPPFDGTIPGLPDPLKKRLAGIEHCATVGLQSWATGDALYPASLISGIAAPLRCTAAMDHLVEGNFKKPVYACGEIDDGAAKDWRPNGKAPAEWRKQYAGRLQAGTPSSIFVSVNATASERYVKANPKTQKARPHVFETGVKNLWLAGDWTRTALSCGSIEAAVTSGLEAARDILQKLDCTVNFKIVASILREKEYDQKTRA